MKKLLWTSIPSILIAAIVLTGILIYPTITFSQNVSSVVGVKTSDIVKIELINGKNGEQIEITDKAKIKELLGIFRKTRLIKRVGQKPVEWYLLLNVKIYTKSDSTGNTGFSFSDGGYFIRNDGDKFYNYFMTPELSTKEIKKVVDQYEIGYATLL